MALRLVTWNMLHAIHAQNWDEFPVRAADYSEEARQQAAMAVLRDLVARRYGDEVLVLALQEVSGAQAERIVALVAESRSSAPAVACAVLKCQLGEPATLREGKRRAGYAAPLGATDTQMEMLVVVGGQDALESVREAQTHVFENSAGNGYCALDIVLPPRAGAPARPVTVASVHVSYGEKRAPQLAALAELAVRGLVRGVPTCLVAGDYNCTEATVGTTLAPLYHAGTRGVSVVSPQSATRIGKVSSGPTVEAETIDHVVMFSADVTTPALAPTVVRVLKTPWRTLSDHRPVEVIFE